MTWREPWRCGPPQTVRGVWFPKVAQKLAASGVVELRLVLMTIHDVMKLDILRPTVGCGEPQT